MAPINILSLILARIFKLPPTETYHVAKQIDQPTPMADGVVLLADRYYPVNESGQKATASPLIPTCRRLNKPFSTIPLTPQQLSCR